MALNQDSLGFWLDPLSDEYDEVCHHLKLSVSESGFPRNIEVWKIDNFELKSRYDKRSQNLQKLVSFSNVDMLPPSNSLQNISSRGFTFPEGGMLFGTGLIDLPVSTAKKIQSLVYSEIAIGCSVVIDEIPSDMQLPLGRESFYLAPLPLDRNKDGQFSLSEYAAAASFDARSSRFVLRFMLYTCPLCL